MTDEKRTGILACLRHTTMTTEEIGSLFEVSAQTVNKIRRDAGIKKRKRKHDSSMG